MSQTLPNKPPKPTAPYPGLRPFRQDEAKLFFGRDAQIDDVLARLKQHQFLGVVGTSGCGKSSLIRAGMLPALESGLMGELGSSWFIADMKPGDAPLTNLAKALMQSGVLGDRWSNTPEGIALLTAALRRSDVSLVNLIQQVQLPKYTNLLVLADQFEEIFRFQQSDPNEALAFVNLLLATGHDRSTPIYVVLTMRSDFLGPCALFPGLPEALNDAQYLCPRLTRDQLAEAIEGPASVFGGEVERALVTQIVNDAGANSDQLPLVQHVLARMWHLNFGDAFGTGASRTDRVLRLEDYLDIGGLKGGSPPNRHRARPDGSTASALFGTSVVAQQPLSPTVVPSLRRRDERPGTTEVAKKPLNHPGGRGGESTEAAPSPASLGFPKELRSGNALSQHADEAYFELRDGSQGTGVHDPDAQPSRRQFIAQMLFRCLAERGPSGQYVRRPVKVQDVAAVAGCSVREVIEVVEVFRREDRSFLVPPVGVTLEAQSVLDISHEALIRQWQRFGGQNEQADGADSSQSWLALEDQSRRRYRRLAEAADSEPVAGLLRDPELSFLDKWWQQFQPREAWGNGCVKGSFQRTKTFLAQSRDAAQYEKQRVAEAREAEQDRKTRNLKLGIFATVLLSLLIGGFWGVSEYRTRKSAYEFVDEFLRKPTEVRVMIRRLGTRGLRRWVNPALRDEIRLGKTPERVLCARALLVPNDSEQAAPMFESLHRLPIGSTHEEQTASNTFFQELCWILAEFATKDVALNELPKLEEELHNLKNKLQEMEESLRKTEEKQQNSEVGRLRSDEANLEERPTRDHLTILRIRLGQRRAAVGIALLRNQEWAAALRAVRVFDGDPEAMSQLCTHCRDCRVQASQLISALDWVADTEYSDSSQGEELPQPSAGTDAADQHANLPRVSLLMALGQYDFTDIPGANRERLKTQLLNWFKDDKSSAIHGVTGWLLRRWGFEEQTKDIEQEIAGPIPKVLDKEWFVLEVEPDKNREAKSDDNRVAYFTFVVFKPGAFKMGAPKYALYRKFEDLPYQVTLTHRFAVCDRELTRQQSNQSQQSPSQLDTVELNLPIVPDWASSVEYCNQLTWQLFRDKSHNYYVPLGGELVPDKDHFFTKAGFRLPTDAEWEYVCRSGTQTPYGFGSDETLLKGFGRDAIDRPDSVGQLRPNLRGVFDLHGNVGEWCSDGFIPGDDEQREPAEDPFVFHLNTEKPNQRVVRGATFRHSAEASSAARRWNSTTSKYGIRLVLTLPESDVKK